MCVSGFGVRQTICRFINFIYAYLIKIYLSLSRLSISGSICLAASQLVRLCAIFDLNYVDELNLFIFGLLAFIAVTVRGRWVAELKSHQQQPIKFIENKYKQMEKKETSARRANQICRVLI